MTIMRINKCKKCHRIAELTERNGGWTVDCRYSNVIVAVESGQSWCDVEHERLKTSNYGILKDTPNEAILHWNRNNIDDTPT
jgi:hypothetical protein